MNTYKIRQKKKKEKENRYRTNYRGGKFAIKSTTKMKAIFAAMNTF